MFVVHIAKKNLFFQIVHFFVTLIELFCYTHPKFKQKFTLSNG